MLPIIPILFLTIISITISIKIPPSKFPAALITPPSANATKNSTLSYLHDTSDFQDIFNAMTKRNGNASIGEVCVARGVFSLYSSPSFQHNGSQANIIWAGKEPFCTKPKKLGSLQLLSHFSNPNKSAVFAFPQKRFQGKGMLVKSYDFGQTFGSVKSLILVGIKSFEILKIHGQQICLTPNDPSGKKPFTKKICFFPEFDKKWDYLALVRLGCSEESQKVLMKGKECVEFKEKGGTWGEKSGNVTAGNVTSVTEVSVTEVPVEVTEESGAK